MIVMKCFTMVSVQFSEDFRPPRAAGRAQGGRRYGEQGCALTGQEAAGPHVGPGFLGKNAYPQSCHNPLPSRQSCDTFYVPFALFAAPISTAARLQESAQETMPPWSLPRDRR